MARPESLLRVSRKRAAPESLSSQVWRGTTFGSFIQIPYPTDASRLGVGEAVDLLDDSPTLRPCTSTWQAMINVRHGRSLPPSRRPSVLRRGVGGISYWSRAPMH